MNKLYIDFISKTLNVYAWQVEHCIELFEEGSTIPFVSRYRKERTGGLDEVQVTEIKHYHQKFDELEKRKTAVVKSIEEQGKLTEELKRDIDQCLDTNRLEDMYLPYKPKRRTKASIAKEKGLEPLAEKILKLSLSDCEKEASSFINDNVKSVEEALSGARDIVAEWISETPKIREELRNEYIKKAKITSKQQKGIEEE